MTGADVEILRKMRTLTMEDMREERSQGRNGRANTLRLRWNFTAQLATRAGAPDLVLLPPPKDPDLSPLVEDFPVRPFLEDEYAVSVTKLDHTGRRALSMNTKLPSRAS